jgi:hypothetical protein
MTDSEVDAAVNQTGTFQVPLIGRLNVMGKSDVARLCRWAVLFSLDHAENGFEVRQFIRKMQPFLYDVDLILLAELVKDTTPALYDELIASAMKSSGGSVGE